MNARLPLARAALAALLLAVPCTSPAQTATAPALKAAFLYNFAKFTEWPVEALPAKAPLVICVEADWRVRQALQETAAGRRANDHEVHVRGTDRHEPLRGCHVVYADNLDAARAAQLLDRTRGASTFVVSDFSGFAALGGTANLFIEEGRMRFAINLEAAQRARLRLSSRLLGLARIVREGSHGAPK